MSENGDRDFVAEMNAFIDEVLGDEPFVAAVAAEKIVVKLHEADPELLAGWLDLNATQFVRKVIVDRDVASRSHARRSAGRKAFADAAELFEHGDSGKLTEFLTMPFTVDGGLRKHLADMDSADLAFTAAHYEQREVENRMTKVFLLALKKKVGRKTVGEVFDEATLASMWRSITAGKAA